MAKKKIIRRNDKPLNILADGGYNLAGLTNTNPASGLSIPTSSPIGGLGSTMGTIGNKLGGIISSPLGGALAGVGANIVGGLIAGQNETGVGNLMQSASSIVGAVNPLAGAAVGLAGGLVNAAFGSKINKDFVNQTESSIKNQSNYVSGASTNNQLMADWSAYGDLANVKRSQVGSDGWFSNKAKNKTKSLNKQIAEANSRAWSSLSNTASNIDTQNDLNLMANYSAYGGYLPVQGSQAIDYELSNKDLNNKQLGALSKFKLASLPNSFGAMTEFDGFNTFADGGSIHIKPENRGKFTKYCGGKVTSACIAKGKHSSSPAVRERATFAANTRKWHHAFGGWLNTSGGDFDNGITIIDEGGTHEENPLTGVPMGVAPDGTPNLVEEGEVLFNDYVFSNRLQANGSLLEQFSLPSKYEGYTFADIAEKLNKESSERPNDPISKRGLLSNMSKLMQIQEEVKAKKDNKKEGKQFADGGPMNSWDNVLLDNTPFTWEDYEKAQGIQPTTTDGNLGIGLDALRYAPAIGGAVGVALDLLGNTNKPTSSANMILDATGNLPTISASPIGNYLGYKPLDRDFYINKLNAQSGSTRRALQNTAGGNRSQAQSGILAADYNYGQNLGDLGRKAEEYNMQQRERVEAFNRGTNQYNSEASMKAAIANQANKELQLKGIITAAQMKDEAEGRSSAARSANLTNFFDSLGDIGREEFTRNMIESNPAYNYSLTRRGKVKYKKGK